MNNATVQLTGSTVSINNTRDLTIGASTIGGSLTINTVAAPITTGNVTLGAGFGSAAQDINIGGTLTVSTNNAFITEDPSTITNVFGSLTLNTLPTGTFPGTVLGVSLQGGGIGYTGTPTITFSGPGGGGTTATGTAIMGTGATAGQIVGINITNIGSGYTTVPTITFSTTGSFASASAVANTGGRVSFTAASSSVTGGGRYGQFNVTSSFIDLNENTALNLGSITGQTVSINSTASDVLINGTLTAGALTARASSGSIIEGGSGVVLIGGASSFNASNSFGTNLSNTGNVFGGAVNVRNGLTNVIVSGSALTIASGTCVTAGNSTLTVSTVGAANTLRTNGEVSRLIGTSSGSIIIDGGNHSTILNLTANDPGASSITQSAGVRSDGTLTLASAGNTTLSQVSNNITNVVLNNTIGDTLVFSARNLTLSGSANGNVTAAAGTAVAGASTNTFSNPWNVVLGNLNVRQNLNVGAFNGNTTVAPVTSISVTNGGTGYTAAPTVTVTGGNGVGATATALVAGGVVTGVIITSPGSGFVTAPTVTFGAVTGASGAAATAVVPGPIGLTGTATGGNAIAGSSGNITQQTGTRTHVESTMDLVTFNGNIVLANNGNNFGRVQASTGGGTGLGGTGDITIVEDASMKVGLIATTGNVSLTSRFGSVVEDSVNNVIITANGTSSVLNLSAPSGSVQLGGLTRTSGTTTGNVSAVNITVSGSAQLATTGNLTLGPTSANSLAVTANNISQSGPLNIFGTSSFNATNSITLTNSANNFGPLTLISQTTNQNIAVTEGSTLNLRSVTMPGGGNGTFTATSVSGDIIDTGLGGVRLGGAVVLNSPVVGTGVVTLAATNGNIVLDDPTSDVLSTSGVVFNSQNVTISVLGSLGSTLVLGAAGVPSVVSGNLTASSALGNIGNAGPLTVGGTASFQTGNGNITIAQSGVGFGSVRFVGNQVSISEGGNMDILTGSTAFGPANLVSGGSISIVDAGSNQNVTFGNTVNMSATGNITLRLLQAVGQLAATASGTKDLSALSLSTDLNGKTPIFGGSGANIDPKP
jgi:hypothetical protein